MVGLKRKKEDLDQEMSRLSKEMRQLRRRVTSGRRVQLSELQRNTARSLMVMRLGEPTAAMGFLRARRKGADFDAAVWAGVERDLRDWWRGANDDTKDSHQRKGDTNQKMHGAIKQAQRFLVDADLAKWVEDQNISKGINPVPALVLQEANQVKTRVGVEVSRLHRSSRQWLRRWRGRCGLKLRKFPAIEPLDEAQMHGKATTRMDT